MNICVIPARGGSKRIPRKNIKEFNGKPIIAYSIEAALKSNCFDQVIVSTDSDEIAEVAKKYGAHVPFIRPDKLSNDYIGILPVIKHAIEHFKKNKVSYVCCLYATAPFISSKIIQESYRQLLITQANYCFSATTFPFPVQRAIRIDENGKIGMLYPEYFNSRSQDLEEAYHDAGQFCWGEGDAFRQMKNVFSDSSTPFILPRHLVQDIDTYEDWTRAELMFKALYFIKK
jgi:pseudaminic acid cytidylyltransferase